LHPARIPSGRAATTGANRQGPVKNAPAVPPVSARTVAAFSRIGDTRIRGVLPALEVDMTTRSLAHPAPVATTRHTVPSWLALVGFIVLCNAAGYLGTLVGNQGYYLELTRPGWAPPTWVFGPAWITLYVLMGTATWLVWRTPPSAARREALTWFAVQLALNAAWTPVFFGLENPAAGFALILTIPVTVTGMIVSYARLSRAGAALLLPLWLWVGFATLLNGAIWWLNR
jgi:benzodiazapine receptor